MSAYEFSRITNISKQKAENVLTLYHNTYTGIRKTFHQYIEDEIKKKRMLFNPFGRRYVFFGYLDETTYKTGYSFIPQSTITDINKQALARLYKKWNCLLDTHDGILFSVPENQIEQASKEIVSAYASIKFKIWNIEHTIPVEIKVGKNWKDMTEIEIDKKEN